MREPPYRADEYGEREARGEQPRDAAHSLFELRCAERA